MVGKTVDMKKKLPLFAAILIAWSISAQNIREITHDVRNGIPSSSVNQPGTILYPVGYSSDNLKTPVVFVHGFTGKLTSSYEANIEAVKSGRIKAAFVQLEPMGSTEDNGMLLKKMIDRITARYGVATVSIVAHSKGGMDTERALYGKNPYNPSIPSFGFEKVDAVYTFGSPLKGSRVADIGASLSWTGIAWIAMWYTHAYSLTSASVQQFHNWASSWRINSNGSFRNYYHPSGASYSRLNLTEDNTTRWWAHQSDDPCYGGRWYYCYVGNGFHKTVGAYYDAEWVWDGLNSGFRNWHPENDGFIAVYRAQRDVIENASPSLTPGAGDFNYITMRDADHSSLWEPGENHFAREVLPYLHYGLYAGSPTRFPDSGRQKPGSRPSVTAEKPNIYLSNGRIYIGRNGYAEITAENAPEGYLIWIYAPSPVLQLSLRGAEDRFLLTPYKTSFDALAGAYVSFFETDRIAPGIYRLETATADTFVAGVLNRNPEKAFAVNWNWDENTGFTGKPIEIKIENQDDASHTEVRAELSLLSNQGKPLPAEKISKQQIPARPVNPGHYRIELPPLQKGELYALAVTAHNRAPGHELARGAYTTFYVYEELPVRDINVASAPQNTAPDYGSLIYPNPAADYFTVSTPGKAFISVKDLTGKIIHEMHVNRTGKVEVKDWPAGIYTVQIRTAEGTEVRKLLVR